MTKQRKSNRSKSVKKGRTTRPFNQKGPSMQRTSRIPKIKRGGLRPSPVLNQLSEAGRAFLKCAFASPDFSVDPGKGIPDQFHGRTLGIKDCYTTAVAFTPAKDTYIILAPVPGYAYFKAEVDIGTDPKEFLGVAFPTFQTNFGTDGTDSENNFSKFRYASMAGGLYPTSNMMQFSGSIQAWRVDLNLCDNLKTSISTTGVIADNSVVTKRIQGISGIVPLAPRDNYSNSFIEGAYTFAFDKSQDFTWCDFTAGQVYQQALTVTSGNPSPAGKYLKYNGTHYLTGLGNVNTIVFKISTPAAAVNTAILRVWNCIELQPDTNSALFQFSGISPPHDPLALELYHNLKMQFPVALPCSENAKFWESVLKAMWTATYFAKHIPGPIGAIAGGANAILSYVT